MNKELMDMAIEAGFSAWAIRTPKDIEAFAALVRADEREACAKVCDNTFYSVEAAQKIRSRGQA